MKNIIPAVLLLSLSISLSAQPLRSITYEMMVAKAEELMEKADYKNALDFYQQAYEEKKEPEMALKIADVHYLLKDYGKAARQYKTVLRRDKKDLGYMDSCCGKMTCSLSPKRPAAPYPTSFTPCSFS